MGNTLTRGVLALLCAACGTVTDNAVDAGGPADGGPADDAPPPADALPPNEQGDGPPPAVADMVLVPAGPFAMGCNAGDEGCGIGEQPRHTVEVDAFYIDRTEVSQLAYAACVEAGTCDAMPGLVADSAYPVQRARWLDAVTFCRWIGKRLPTEAEWEKAARGTDARPYPWGVTPPDPQGCDPLLSHRCPFDLATADSMPSGASPYGALHMSGNVTEWVADWYAEGYEANPPVNPTGPASGTAKVSRGGDSQSPLFFGELTYQRVAFNPGDRGERQGFRCAYRGAP